MQLANHDLIMFLRQAKINIETYKEAANAANGNGSGIVLIAKTSTGCVLGITSML